MNHKIYIKQDESYKELLFAEEVAEQLHVSKDYLRTLIKRKKLKGFDSVKILNIHFFIKTTERII